MKSGSSNQSNQQVTTTQNTTVSVQNIIEAPKPSPLEKLKLLSEVLVSLDGGAAPAAASQAAIVVNPDPLAFLKDPQSWIWIGAGVLAIVLVAKKA